MGRVNIRKKTWLIFKDKKKVDCGCWVVVGGSIVFSKSARRLVTGTSLTSVTSTTVCVCVSAWTEARGSFGPYAPELKQRIRALVNNGLVFEEGIGRMFAVRVGRTFVDAERAYRKQIDQ